MHTGKEHFGRIYQIKLAQVTFSTLLYCVQDGRVWSLVNGQTWLKLGSELRSDALFANTIDVSEIQRTRVMYSNHYTTAAPKQWAEKNPFRTDYLPSNNDDKVHNIPDAP